MISPISSRVVAEPQPTKLSDKPGEPAWVDSAHEARFLASKAVAFEQPFFDPFEPEFDEGPQYAPNTDAGKIVERFHERYGKTPAPDVRATRDDLGLGSSDTLVVDIGGEGQKTDRSDGLESGNVHAVNLNWQEYLSPGPFDLVVNGNGEHISIDGEDKARIPNLIRPSRPWEQNPSYPFADDTVDGIMMEGAPLTDHNVDEISRVIKPGGWALLNIGDNYEPQVNELAERMGAEVVETPMANGISEFLLIPKDYKGVDPKEWRSKSGTKGVTSSSFYEWVNYQKSAQGGEPDRGRFPESFDKDFYDKHREHFGVIRENWDKWAKWIDNDNIVSDKDLNRIADGENNATKEERKAADFLLNHPGLFDFLDTARDGPESKKDGKISTHDLNTWFDEIGYPSIEKTSKLPSSFDWRFYDEHQEHFKTIRSNWNKWAKWIDNDNIVSDKDLNRIIDGENNATKEERKAAEFLLNHPGLFDFLDTARDGPKAKKDGKVSSHDLNKWFDMIGYPSLDQTRNVPTSFYWDFHDEHQDHFDTIRSNWGKWKGKDSIVSDADLRKIRDGQNNATREEIDAADFLLKEPHFFEYLDAIRTGTVDTKVSSNDLNKWFEAIGRPKLP